jgi:hypothetical protein
LKNIVVLLAIFVVLLSLWFVPFVTGHSPIHVGDNESLDSATVVPDATKSWALYAELSSDGNPQYYTFNITVGEIIRVSLFKSMRSDESDFKPMFAILGPNLNREGSLPRDVSVPEGYNWRTVSSGVPDPTYEPFSPSSYYDLSDVEFDAPNTGQYFIVVYENTSNPIGGHYGLAIGFRESFTLEEWVLLPINLLDIYIWSGQTLPVILAPMIVTVIVGLVLVSWQLNTQGKVDNVFSWVGAIAGLILIGSGANTMLQMLIANYGFFGAIENFVTVVFVAVPIVLGFIALRLSFRTKPIGIKHRIYFVIIGLIAIFILAGLLAGPILAIAASVMPAQIKRKPSK